MSDVVVQQVVTNVTVAQTPSAPSIPQTVSTPTVETVGARGPAGATGATGADGSRARRFDAVGVATDNTVGTAVLNGASIEAVGALIAANFP